MLKISHNDDQNGKRILLTGRLDARYAPVLEDALEEVEDSVTIDFSRLDYISSAGLGVLLKTQKRLLETGEALKLVNLNPHIAQVFEIAGFHFIFTIESAPKSE